MNRLQAAARRLPNIPSRLRALMVARDLPTCEYVVALCEADVRASDEAKPNTDPHADHEWSPAGPLLLALWAARDYENLARAGAPTDEDAWPCAYGPAGIGCSNGSGIVYGRGHTENGVFKGATYVCVRCQGKGWMSKADRARCQYHDDRYVIHA